jgi:hypothetical protein
MLPPDFINQIARDRICERRAAADNWRLAHLVRSVAEDADRMPRWRLFRRRPADAPATPATAAATAARAATAEAVDATAVAPVLARVTTKFAGDCGP